MMYYTLNRERYVGEPLIDATGCYRAAPDNLDFPLGSDQFPGIGIPPSTASTAPQSVVMEKFISDSGDVSEVHVMDKGRLKPSTEENKSGNNNMSENGTAQGGFNDLQNILSLRQRHHFWH